MLHGLADILCQVSVVVKADPGHPGQAVTAMLELSRLGLNLGAVFVVVFLPLSQPGRQGEGLLLLG
jgi:hypothetical protein